MGRATPPMAPPIARVAPPPTLLIALPIDPNSPITCLLDLRDAYRRLVIIDRLAGGTFFPARRAEERPIATACFREVTFGPPLPE
jgi:hypothetical protein